MFTTISRHFSPLDASIIHGRLLAEGIPAHMLYNHHIWANLWLALALGGIQIVVWHTHQEAAAKVLNKISNNEFQLPDSETQEALSPMCPKCGSKNSLRHDWLPKLSLLALILSHVVIFPYSRHLYSCRTCKHDWIAKEQRNYQPGTLALSILIVSCLILFIFFSLITLFGEPQPLP